MTAVTDRTGTDGGRRGRRVRFVPVVGLSKEEVFAACQALADADRHLVRAGHHAEADALGDLFERLEARLTGSSAGRAPYPTFSPTGPTPARAPDPSDRVYSGSYSNESELTQ